VFSLTNSVYTTESVHLSSRSRVWITDRRIVFFMEPSFATRADRDPHAHRGLHIDSFATDIIGIQCENQRGVCASSGERVSSET